MPINRAGQLALAAKKSVSSVKKRGKRQTVARRIVHSNHLLAAEAELNRGGGKLKRKRVLPPIYLLVAIVAMVALHFLLPVMRIVPLLWSLLGFIPLACGIGIEIIADNALRAAKTTVKPFEQSTALVTSGVYGISRHPMYLGFVLILIGIAVMMGSLTPFIVILPFVIVMDRGFISVEERMLEERFGKVWLEYKHRVRRWL